MKTSKEQLTDELKVGDWVHVLIAGFRSGDSKNDPAYHVEKIEGDDYHVVQTEGSYQHKLVVKRKKLKKL
jgi:hypothetical protein